MVMFNTCSGSGGLFGGGCSWIIILILIFCVCGGGNLFGKNEKCC
jgi:hypothetical protein